MVLPRADHTFEDDTVRADLSSSRALLDDSFDSTKHTGPATTELEHLDIEGQTTVPVPRIQRLEDFLLAPDLKRKPAGLQNPRRLEGVLEKVVLQGVDISFLVLLEASWEGIAC